MGKGKKKYVPRVSKRCSSQLVAQKKARKLRLVQTVNCTKRRTVSRAVRSSRTVADIAPYPSTLLSLRGPTVFLQPSCGILGVQRCHPRGGTRLRRGKSGEVRSRDWPSQKRRKKNKRKSKVKHCDCTKDKEAETNEDLPAVSGELHDKNSSGKHTPHTDSRRSRKMCLDDSFKENLTDNNVKYQVLENGVGTTYTCAGSV